MSKIGVQQNIFIDFAVNVKHSLHGLNHLRAFAILLVFFYHYRMFDHPDWVDEYAAFGWTGVDLFFILSGFLISSQLFEQLKINNKININEFFVKRFFRIIPPYLAITLLYFLFPLFREREALPPIWKFLTFTQNFNLDVINSGTFSHAWSLCIEEQFYLTFPFLLLFIYKRKQIWDSKLTIPTLLVLVIILRLFSWYGFIAPNLESDNFWLQWYKWIYYPTYTRLDGLFIGVGLAAIFHYNEKAKKIIHQNGNKLFLLGLVLLIIAYFICKNQYSFTASIFGFTLVSVAYGSIVASAISNTSTLFKFKSYLTSQIASMSYSIYLSHKGVIHITQKILQNSGLDTHSNSVLIICIVVCIIIALFFRYIIENPALRIRNLILNKNYKTISTCITLVIFGL